MVSRPAFATPTTRRRGHGRAGRGVGDLRFAPDRLRAVELYGSKVVPMVRDLVAGS